MEIILLNTDVNHFTTWKTETAKTKSVNLLSSGLKLCLDLLRQHQIMPKWLELWCHSHLLLLEFVESCDGGVSVRGGRGRQRADGCVSSVQMSRAHVGRCDSGSGGGQRYQRSYRRWRERRGLMGRVTLRSRHHRERSTGAGGAWGTGLTSERTDTWRDSLRTDAHRRAVNWWRTSTTTTQHHQTWNYPSVGSQVHRSVLSLCVMDLWEQHKWSMILTCLYLHSCVCATQLPTTQLHRDYCDLSTNTI